MQNINLELSVPPSVHTNLDIDIDSTEIKAVNRLPSLSPPPPFSLYTQDDQKVSVHLMITIQNTTWLNLAAWQLIARARGTLIITLTPSVTRNSNCVIMVSD
jgi:hypothetical protein